MKIGILLSGCGVYDGAEIQESVLAMLAIKELGFDYQCIALDKDQHHVVNHLNGEEMAETRNMKIEAARIGRGDVMDINEATPAIIDALVIPGGFGAAKNFTDWAFEGPEGNVLPEIKLLIVNMVNAGKPICALCVSPVTIAKALEDSNIKPQLTVGTSQNKSPYDIESFHAGLNQVGATTVEKSVNEILVDYGNKIVTAPCYMMDANILEIRENIKAAVEATAKLLS